MSTITIYPQNKERFIALLSFLEEILDICPQIQTSCIIDGSLAVFLYTGNTTLVVNDIDLTCKEKDYQIIASILAKHGFATQIQPWHVLQVRKDGLKIEFGDPEYWYPGLPIISTQKFSISKYTLGILAP